MINEQPEGSITPQRFISENRKKTAVQFLRPVSLQSHVNKSQQLLPPARFQNQRLSQFGALIDPNTNVKRSTDRISYVSSNTAKNRLRAQRPCAGVQLQASLGTPAVSGAGYSESRAASTRG